VRFTYRILELVTLDLDWTGDCSGQTWACEVLDVVHSRLGDVGEDAFDTFQMFVMTVAQDATGCPGIHISSARSAVVFANASSVLPSLAFAYAHEMGHAWWQHAKRGVEQYGDRSDVMGGNGEGAIAGLRHTNAPHKINANWLGANDIMTVDEINNGGWNEIGPLSLAPTTRPLAVQIPVRNEPASFYTISYRIDVGYDALLANPDLANPDPPTYYIDLLTIHKGDHVTTPGMTPFSELLAFVPAGIIYDSPGGEFSVRNVSVNNTRARFKLTVSTDLTPPSIPVVSYTTNCTGAHVTWTASVDEAGGSGFDHYQVFYSGAQTGGAWVSDPLTTNQHRDFTLSLGEQLTVIVHALDAAGNDAYVSQTITMPSSAPPSTPTGLTAYAPHQWVTLSWNASGGCSSVDYYEVERADVGSRGTTGTTSFDDNSTQELTTYSYRVRARNVAGFWSGWTSYYHVTTGPEINIE